MLLGLQADDGAVPIHGDLKLRSDLERGSKSGRLQPWVLRSIEYSPLSGQIVSDFTGLTRILEEATGNNVQSSFPDLLFRCAWHP